MFGRTISNLMTKQDSMARSTATCGEMNKGSEHMERESLGLLLLRTKVRRPDWGIVPLRKVAQCGIHVNGGNITRLNFAAFSKPMPGLIFEGTDVGQRRGLRPQLSRQAIEAGG